MPDPITPTHRQQAQALLTGLHVSRDESVVALAQVHATLALSDPKPLPTVQLRRPDDEIIDLLIDGVEVASVNHDDQGRAGMAAFEKLAVTLVRAFGGEITEVEFSDDEDGAA